MAEVTADVKGPFVDAVAKALDHRRGARLLSRHRGVGDHRPGSARHAMKRGTRGRDRAGFVRWMSSNGWIGVLT